VTALYNANLLPHNYSKKQKRNTEIDKQQHCCCCCYYWRYYYYIIKMY